MIINIAGTSGAGKTWVMRHLIAHSRYAATMKAVLNLKETEREREIGRIVHIGERSVFIAGRYDDIDSGGCDSIQDVKFWYHTIWNQAQTHDVVFEGLFVMNHTRGLDLTNKCLKAGLEFHVILLTTPLDVCKASVNERRVRRGQAPFERSWGNVEGNVVRAKNFAYKVKAIGATMHALDRAAAANKLMELLNGDQPQHQRHER
jgi:hypothetical protein